MGFEKIKRPILAQGLHVRSSGASTTPASIAGDVAAQGDIRVGGVFDIPTETSTSTGTLSVNGVSFLQPGGSTADKVFTLPAPSAVGAVKWVINGTSGVRLVTVQITASTATGHLFGTTFRQIQFSSAAPGAAEASESVQLIARTTSQWAVASASTGVTFAA